MPLVDAKKIEKYKSEAADAKKEANIAIKDNQELGKIATEAVAAPIVATATMIKDSAKPPIIYIYDKGKEVIIEVRKKAIEGAIEVKKKAIEVKKKVEPPIRKIKKKINPYIEAIKAAINKLRFKFNNPTMSYPGMCDSIKLKILGLTDGNKDKKKDALKDIKDKQDAMSKTKKGGNDISTTPEQESQKKQIEKPAISQKGGKQKLKKYELITTSVKTKYGTKTTVRMVNFDLNSALNIINEIFHIIKELGFNTKKIHNNNTIKKLWKTRKKICVISFKKKIQNTNTKIYLSKPTNLSKKEIIIAIEERKNKKKGRTRKRKRTYKKRKSKKKRKSLKYKKN